MMKNLLNQTNLLGATELNELVFANISIRENKTLSVSFNLVKPTIIDNDYLYERFTSIMDSLSKEDRYDLCIQYNCSPNNLIDEMFAYASVEDILDISLVPYELEVNNDTFVFESSSCGQCETRNLMSEYVNKDCYMRLMGLWDTYHLQTIEDDTIKEVETIIEKLNECDELQWIEDYIKECYYR